jgi:hypothetical protein
VETIGQSVRRLLEKLERTAKARNEAPDALEDRDEFERLSGFDEFQISNVERTAAPTVYAGRNDEPQIVRQGHTPANKRMLCSQQRGSTGYGPSCRSIPVAANCNRRQLSLRHS